MNAVAAKVHSQSIVQRFIDNGDGTITDTTTGLMWSQATLNKRGISHAKAEKLCAELDLAGHKDWRLPTADELFALADRSRHSPAIDIEAFPDTRSDWYWTSTPSAWASSCAWLVDFDYGYASHNRRDYDAFVRAVRAAPAGQ
ncbi:MAG: DUF1566 domain-containing protein [Mizugakiibacter sp.]|uniref:Lcl C-terminal domain-containing protein n=1 Tax=Mizugakiibacter sp. TaxID=1972610 RepID=UPI00320E6278